MKDRIKLVRKDVSLTQEEFGSELGVSRIAITTYETGRVIPDKSIRLLICEKFYVNETWLETGEGAIYKEKSGISPDLLLALRNMPAVKAALERLLPRLTVEDMEHINDLVQRIIDGK